MSRYLRMAAVQLEYAPTMRSPSGAWIPAEPLAPTRPLDEFDDDSSLHRLLGRQGAPERARFQDVINSTESAYHAFITAHLREILSFCHKHAVDLVVLPEYSVPAACVEA